MINLLYNIGQVLGVTIIHSLWQGLLIYFVLRLIFSSMPNLSSAKKYNFSTVGLMGMAAWFIYTFCVQAYAFDWKPAQVVYAASTDLDLLKVQIQTMNAHADFKTNFYNSIKVYLPYVSIIYAIGLVVNFGRLIFALKNIRVIKRSIIKADNLQDRINEFCLQLKIRRKVQVAFSRLVEVPCVIGYIKPLLLLPITLTFQLSPEEIETIVLHELSHIKRNDYLVNMIQQLISVLLFFNPFSQLISNIISTERENRCDDMVVEKTESPLTYAYALLKLEEVRQTEVRLALAATQNKNHLLNRIERIMKTKTPIGNIRPILVALLLIAGSLSVAWLNPEVKNGKVTFKKVEAIRSASAAEVVPVAKIEPVKHHQKRITMAYADTAKGRLDTTKKKIKIIVEDDNGNKKEYNSVDDMPEADKKDFYKETLNHNFNFNFDMKMDSNMARINKFYQSDKWKKQVAELQANAMKMGEKFNNGAFKKQAEAMKLNGEAMQKKMKLMNDEMQKKFNSPEFKKRMEEFQQKMNSPEFKKQMEDMGKQGAEMDKYFNSPQWKAQVDVMAKQGEEMAKMYDSPEWKKQIEDIGKQGADMAKAFDNPEFEKQVEKMAKAYDSPEFKKQMEQLSNMKFDINYSSDEKPERKERAERKEKIERKEKAEIKGKIKAQNDKVKNQINKQIKAVKAEAKERAEKPEAPEQPEN